MRHLKIRQAFEVIFDRSTIISRAYFFVTVPFLLSIFQLIVGFINNPFLSLFTLIIVLVFLSLYVLYLWYVSFFYSTQISEFAWDEPEYDLREMFSDYSTKLKLLFIRITWYLPGIIFVLAAILSGVGISAVILFVAIVWMLLVEYTFLNVSLSIFSATENIISAFNIFKIVKILFLNIIDYFILNLLAFIQIPVLFLVMIPLSLLLAIPLLGGFLYGLLIGIIILYNFIFLANISGQIWSKSNQTLDQNKDA